MKRLLIVLLLFLMGSSNLVRADEFQVLDIRIEGLQRVSAGTVFASLPLSVGDTVNETVSYTHLTLPTT